MCGIFCALSKKHLVRPNADVERLLRSRGPDSYEHDTSYDAVADTYISIASSVLALRGCEHVRQPYRNSSQDAVLCWNGEAWRRGNELIEGNDTEFIYEWLHDISRLKRQDLNRSDQVQRLLDWTSQRLSRISGPFAFIFYDPVNTVILFGRDHLGRRSLLTGITSDGDAVISSVSDGDPEAAWREVEADGIYCVDLLTNSQPACPVDHYGFHGNFVVAKTPYHYGDEGPFKGLGSSVRPVYQVVSA